MDELWDERAKERTRTSRGLPSEKGTCKIEIDKMVVISYTVPWHVYCNLTLSGQNHIEFISKSGAAHGSVRDDSLHMLPRMAHWPTWPTLYPYSRHKQSRVHQNIADRGAQNAPDARFSALRKRQL